MRFPHVPSFVIIIFLVLAVACAGSSSSVSSTGSGPETEELMFRGTFQGWIHDHSHIDLLYTDENDVLIKRKYSSGDLKMYPKLKPGDTFRVVRVKGYSWIHELRLGLSPTPVTEPVEIPVEFEPPKPLFVMSPSATEPTEPNPEPIK